MRFEKLGKYIRQVNLRNESLSIKDLKGINMSKDFFPSVANTVGTDMSKYKIVKRGQFAYNPMHVGRDRLVPISLLIDEDAVIVSPAYVVFEIIDHSLLAQYLLLWFKDSDFDSRAWFTTDNSVRGGFSWESLCELEVPIIDKKVQAIICLRALLENQKKTIAQKLNLIESAD